MLISFFHVGAGRGSLSFKSGDDKILKKHYPAMSLVSKVVNQTLIIYREQWYNLLTLFPAPGQVTTHVCNMNRADSKLETIVSILHMFNPPSQRF